MSSNKNKLNYRLEHNYEDLLSILNDEKKLSHTLDVGSCCIEIGLKKGKKLNSKYRKNVEE